MRRILGLLIGLYLPSWLCGGAASLADEPKFDRVVIDANFPGGYQVEVADVNGDRKPDIIALGGGTCAWYENPSWTKRIVTTPKETPGIISSATADLDGDGKAEIAIAYEFEMNQPKKGKLLLAVQGKTVDEPWTVKPIADVPSIHRLRWLNTTGHGERPNHLVVAPIFGEDAKPPTFDQSPARLVAYRIGAEPKSGKWERVPLAERPVIHAIRVFDPAHGPGLILTADNLGVAMVWVTNEKLDEVPITKIIPGSAGEPPKRGASEIQVGVTRDEKGAFRHFLATIGPWHGNEVAIWPLLDREVEDLRAMKAGPKVVLDDTLDDGHALWTADIDKDGDDEVFAGHRGKDHRVSVYKFDGKAWHRTVIDRDIAAQDLRGGDIDGDGKPDVVAIGGATHNVVWYRPR